MVAASSPRRGNIAYLSPDRNTRNADFHVLNSIIFAARFLCASRQCCLIGSVRSTAGEAIRSVRSILRTKLRKNFPRVNRETMNFPSIELTKMHIHHAGEERRTVVHQRAETARVSTGRGTTNRSEERSTALRVLM